MKKFLCLLLLLVFIPPSGAQDTQAQTGNLYSQHDGINSFWIRFFEASDAGDNEAAVALYTTDAAILGPHQPPIVGHQQLTKHFSEYRPYVKLVVGEFEELSVIEADNVVIVFYVATGHYLVKKTGEQVPFDNKYIDIFRYVDGRWLMATHMFSGNTSEMGLYDGNWRNRPGIGDN